METPFAIIGGSEKNINENVFFDLKESNKSGPLPSFK
jgi:hypothetical protein